MSVKEKIKSKLGETGNLGSGDFANFSVPKETATATDTAEGKQKVPNSAYADPVAAVATEDDHTSAAKKNLKNAGKEAGINIDYDTVEITEDDKNSFIDSLIDNTRYTRQFSIFNGNVYGTIQSRTADETKALIHEAQRRVRTAEVLSDADYSAIFRKAVLRFQIKSLNGVEFPVVQEPLLAQYNFSTVLSENPVTPPKWFEEANQFWGAKQCGYVTAVYAEVMKFEFKYWTLVENSANQDFWHPED